MLACYPPEIGLSHIRHMYIDCVIKSAYHVINITVVSSQISHILLSTDILQRGRSE